MVEVEIYTQDKSDIPIIEIVHAKAKKILQLLANDQDDENREECS